MKSIYLALFSSLVCDVQCYEVKIHLAITSGEQPLLMKNNKSLNVSLSPVRFSRKVAVCWWARFDRIKDASVK